MKENANCSISNIYKLDGRVPIGKAIPFGLQHILAMFVSNLAPITMIAGAAKVPVTGAIPNAEVIVPEQSLVCFFRTQCSQQVSQR